MQKPEMTEVKELADEVSTMVSVDGWNGFIKQEMLTGEMKIQKSGPPLTRRPCLEVFEIAIHPDGDIHLCPCRNIMRDPLLHIGNIQEMSIREAHLKINEVVKRWQKGIFPKICQDCSMYADPAPVVLGRLFRIVSSRVFNKVYF